ncbi:TraR/DksA C4-type zinc finger protein [Streptomyces phytohabitans]|uniref:TraR/DksA family transcriptional regulator n=1 Tax=Streptomyces phytohabitans TaxID=1150371 RepID=UPI00345B721B
MVARRTAAKKTASARQPAPGGRSADDTAAEGKSVTKATSAPVRKAPADQAPSKKTTAKKAPAGKKRATKTPAAKKTGAQTVAAKKTPAKAAAVPTARASRTTPVNPAELAVRPGEDPWTEEEVAEARAELQTEAVRLHAEIASSEEALTGLMRDSGDGAGDDDADTGTKNITREHEMALAANAREMVHQTERALERLEAGTYGLCESCGNAIGKARMQAFPRATLCVECKQKQERR